MTSLPTFIPVLEELVNRYIRLNPEAFEELSGLQGKEIAVELRGLERCVVLCFAADGIHFTAQMAESPDAVVSGAPLMLLRMLLSADESPLIASGDIAVTGDEGLLQRVLSLLRRVDMDWEEQLAGYVGAPMAHRMGNAARNTHRWRQRTGAALADDLRLFLEEELHLVPNREEVAEYVSATDTLGKEVEQLEKRIQRLAREIK